MKCPYVILKTFLEEYNIMSQKILVLAGPKQSGKNTAANFVVGYKLCQLGRQGKPFCPTRFEIDEKGQLIVNTTIISADNTLQEGVGILDLTRTDFDFIQWAENMMWPYVKQYAFADTLKTIAITVFGLTHKQVYGTDADKNTLTNIKWENMARFLYPALVGKFKKSGKYYENMTAREFLQYFGTNVCRQIYDDCWINSCLNMIIAENSELAVITDCRFKNEVYKTKELGAKVIKLSKKNNNEDLHPSEIELNEIPDENYDLILPPKEEISIHDQNQMILDAMSRWGWVGSHINLPEEKG